MSGHSKWSTIKRQKETKDQRRGKVFSKLGKAISIAAKDGGDPATNFRLRLMVERAKQTNMPKENIARAIQKGSRGLGGEKWKEVVYE
ncbi:MAG TPA: YebC/PmpR family DNA-binding transcriptional regulator, partial [Nevskiaceae bacterium]|nr:YebC/PmpR family DNA-binding transcriptional regulator [Nevskiaceae bacterium]